MLAAGDITGCGPAAKRKDAQTAEILRKEVSSAKALGIPIRILALGDLAYPTGTATQFKCFAEHWGSSEFFDLLLPVPGNHDIAEGNVDPYYDFFRKNGLVESNGKRAGYYALDFPEADKGPWRLVALNAYVGHGPASPQVKWLMNDLATSKASCVLVFTHPFILSSGLHGHGDKTKMKHGKSAADAKTISPTSALNLFRAAYPYKPSLFIAGHDHHFEQFGRHDADGKAQADGVRSFVVGTGGYKLYQEKYNTKAPLQEHYDDATHGVLKLKLHSSSYEWEFLPIGGAVYTKLAPAKDDCNKRS